MKLFPIQRPLSLVFFSLLLLSPVAAEMPVNIAPGTTVTEVVKAHGWPSGVSIYGKRQTWNYGTFQVVFEDERVVSGVLVPSGNNPSLHGQMKIASPLTPTVVSPTQDRASDMRLTLPASDPAADNMVASLWPWAGFLILVGVGAIAKEWWRSKRLNAETASGQPALDSSLEAPSPDLRPTGRPPDGTAT